MTSILLTVTGARAWAAVKGPLTAGMVGLPVTIEYDEAWEGLTKNLVCRCSPWDCDSGETRTILNVGDSAAVAHEVMKAGLYLHLGVEGFSDDGKLVIPTTWAECGKIEYGANTCEDPSTDPELSVWNQLQTEMEQIKEYTLTQEQLADFQAYAQEATQAAQEAKQAADEAKQAANAGVSGLYYTPVVTQPTSDTLKFEFKPSVTGAPVPNPVTVELPVGEDSDENMALTSAQVSSLAAVINAIGAFDADNGPELVAAFNDAWGITIDDGSGDESGDNPGGITVYELPGWTVGSRGVNPHQENSGIGFSAYFKANQNTTYRVVEHGTHNRFMFLGFKSEDWTYDNGLDGYVIANSSTHPGIADLMEFEFNSGEYHWVYVYLAADNTVSPKITVTEVTE